MKVRLLRSRKHLSSGKTSWTRSSALGRTVRVFKLHCHRVTPAVLQAASANLLTLQFGYSPSNKPNNGNIGSQTITAPSLGLTQSYTYDAVNRLMTASEAATAWSQTYTFDGNGNRTISTTSNVWPPGFSPSPFAPIAANGVTYGANNQLSIPGSTTYDNAGNQTVLGGYNSTFDAEGRMTSTTVNGATTSYVYDGEGQRVAKLLCPTASPCSVATPGATMETIYIYDAAGNLAAQFSTGPSRPPCTTCYVGVDHLGSTRMMTDQNGNVVRRYDYLPFGEEIPPDGTLRTSAMGYQSAPDGLNPKFTGQVRDTESGLDFFNARFYSPAQGRFVSPDPDNAGFDPDDPQTWNGYAYVTNSPLVATDPSGLDSILTGPSSDGSDGGEGSAFGGDPFNPSGLAGLPSPFAFYGVTFGPSAQRPGSDSSLAGPLGNNFGQTPLLGMAWGHHLLSRWRLLPKGTSSYKYWRSIRTGGLPNPATNYYDALHRLYDQAVFEIRDRFVRLAGKRSVVQLNDAENRELARKIFNSKDPRIRNFLDRLGSRALATLEGLIGGGTEVAVPVTVGLRPLYNILRCGLPECPASSPLN